MPYLLSYITRGVVVIACILTVSQPSSGRVFDGDPSCPQKCKCSAHFKTISCEHQGLEEIPRGIPPSATVLYLGYNLLAEIKANSFQQLVNLTVLSLRNNKIQKIENGAFNGLKKLKSLTFRNNALRTIDSPLAFQDLDSLQNLYFTSNNLTSVPDLRHVPNLIYLTLDNNNLQTAQLCRNNSCFKNLSTIIFSNNPRLDRVDADDFACVKQDKVRKIDFSRCNLTTIAAGVFKFPHLQSLVLSYNTEFKPDMLRSIFADVEKSDLSFLDLCGVINKPTLLTNETFKGLETVPLLDLKLCHSSNVETIHDRTFQHFKQLKTLDLSNGEMRQIEDTMYNLKNLTELKLENNKLESVPPFHVPNLLSLSLDSNDVKEIPKNVFMGLPGLTNLSMKGCHIQKIEKKAFANLNKLESLDLSSNQLGGNSIPRSSFDNMGQLVVLKLNNNKMTTIATENKLFANLHNLKLLDLSGNQCGNISRLIFNNLGKLSRLTLSGNALGNVINADDNGQLFKHLNSLTILDLDNNGVSDLHDTTFSDLISLKRLNLSGNILTSWTAEMFNSSQHIETLDISRNKISTVGQQAIAFLPATTRLNLTHNPFACWCDLRWFRRWISQLNDTGSKLTGLDSYTCNSPESMAGKALLNFDPDNFFISASCFWFEIMIISISAAIAIITVIFFVIYRYRWSLRLRMYYMQRRWKRKSHSTYETLPDQFRHHLFVSYGPSSRDRDWVIQKLIRKTDRHTSEEDRRRRDENTEPNAINSSEETSEETEATGEWEVFFEDRDLLPNQSEINTLGEAIYNSKRVVLVISKDYLNDGRRWAEIDLALQSRTELHLQLHESIILVLLDPDVDVKLPATLRSIVSRDEQLEWTENDLDGQRLFWDKLEDRIRREFVPQDNIV